MIAKLDQRLAANEKKSDYVGFKRRERVAGLLSVSEPPSTAPAWAVGDGSEHGEIHCVHGTNRIVYMYVNLSTRPQRCGSYIGHINNTVNNIGILFLLTEALTPVIQAHRSSSKPRNLRLSMFGNFYYFISILDIVDHDKSMGLDVQTDGISLAEHSARSLDKDVS